MPGGARSIVAVLLLALAAGAAGAPAPPRPCEDAAGYGDFDFWLGTWAVHVADGRLAGHNRIARAEGGCRIDETWRGVGGAGGSSINFHDPVDGVWEQVWHSPGGAFIRIRGGLDDDGAMVLAGHLHDVSSGVTAPFRGTWTRLDDGRVRQFFEQHDADEGAWQPWFEGFYTRIPEAAFPPAGPPPDSGDGS